MTCRAPNPAAPIEHRPLTATKILLYTAADVRRDSTDTQRARPSKWAPPMRAPSTERGQSAQYTHQAGMAGPAERGWGEAP